MAGDEGPDIPTGAQSPMPFIKSEPASPRRQEADIAQDDREIARESSNVEDTGMFTRQPLQDWFQTNAYY